MLRTESWWGWEGAARGEQSQRAALRQHCWTGGNTVEAVGCAWGLHGSDAIYWMLFALQMCSVGCYSRAWRAGDLANCPLTAVGFRNQIVGGLV